MNGLIEKLASWKVCLIFTGLFLVYLFFVLPNEAQRSALVTGGLASPDTKFIYSSEFLSDLISEYSPEARADYVKAKIRFDILWPLVYGIWLASALGLIAKGLRRFWTLPWLPIAAIIFDYLENLVISIAMLTFPNMSGIVLSSAPILTALKWGALNGSIVLAVILFVYMFTKRLNRRRADGLHK